MQGRIPLPAPVMRFTWIGILIGLSFAALHAQPTEKVILKSNAQKNDQWQVAMTMKVKGNIVMKSGDKTTTIEIGADAEHRFSEMILNSLEGTPTSLARFYEVAKANIVFNQGQPRPRTLRADRRFQVARSSSEGTTLYSPTGPLTREELELTGDHFDTLAIHGILPNKEVAMGEEWDIPIPTAQALADLEGVIESHLKGKLAQVNQKIAYIHVTGTVEGIQQGSELKVTCAGVLEYNLSDQRPLRAEWKLREDRAQGPINQACFLESLTNVQWTYGTVSKELTPALLATIPDEPLAGHLMLTYRDEKGRFQFTHERNWHMVAQTPEFIVMRQMDRGELISQVNITPWKPAKPGQHMEPEDLQKHITQAPGFKVQQIAQQGEIQGQPGYWIYRLSTVGEADGLPLLQNAYAISGPRGDQVVFTFTTEVEHAAKLGTKDQAMVKTVEFPAVMQVGGKQ